MASDVFHIIIWAFPQNMREEQSEADFLTMLFKQKKKNGIKKI